MATILLAGTMNLASAERLVIDTRAVCHGYPSQESTAGPGEFIATNLVTNRNVNAGGAVWYFADQYSIPAVACWVYGPYTIRSRWASGDYAGNHEADWLAVLDHIIARKDAALEEYVEVDNLLPGNTDGKIPGYTALVRFRRLQMLGKAADLVSREVSPIHSPLKLAWLRSKLEKNEPGGTWYVSPRRLWDLFDANRNAPWAEEVAWEAAQISLPGDECDSACMLSVIVHQPLQYWTRLPVGAHIREVLAEGAKDANAAADEACDDFDPAKPGQPSQSPAFRAIASQIRASLVKVLDPEKGRILQALDRAGRRCAK